MLVTVYSTGIGKSIEEKNHLAAFPSSVGYDPTMKTSYSNRLYLNFSMSSFSFLVKYCSFSIILGTLLEAAVSTSTLLSLSLKKLS